MKLARGELSADTPAWFEGSPGWVSLGRIPGLLTVDAPRSRDINASKQTAAHTPKGESAAACAPPPTSSLSEQPSRKRGAYALSCGSVLLTGLVVWTFAMGVQPHESRGSEASTPAAGTRNDESDAPTEEEYEDSVIAAELKRTPAERERAAADRSREDAEKIWLYYFKGRDKNGKPIPYTPAERRANLHAYSTACKLAMEELRKVSVRRGESFVTRLWDGTANQKEWYLREYKQGTYTHSIECVDGGRPSERLAVEWMDHI